MKIVKTKTIDEINLNGLITVAPDSKKIIIHIHGMAGSIVWGDYIQPMHDNYSKAGYSFLVGENRGTGVLTEFDGKDNKTIVIGNAFEKFEDSLIDIQAWIDFAVEIGYEEIWLQAHSLGPSKVAYYMHSKNPTNIKGLIFLSPSDMVGSVHVAEGKKDNDRLLPEAKELIKKGKPKSLLSYPLWRSSLLSAGTYINFFDKGAKTTIFNYQNPNLGWEVVNSIKVPVLALTGTKDNGIAPVMDPYKAMDLLRQELKNSPRVVTQVYVDCYHGFEGFADMIVSDVLNFVSETDTVQI